MFTLSPDIIIAILIGTTLLLTLLVVRLEIRLSRVFRGKQGSDLEDIVKNLENGLLDFRKFQEELGRYVSVLEKRLGRSTQSIVSRRYNPFKGAGEGGNHSSSTAIVSEKGDGIILTTLYARERMSVFIKPIDKFSAAGVDLTPEEQEAIAEAKEKLKQ